MRRIHPNSGWRAAVLLASTTWACASPPLYYKTATFDGVGGEHGRVDVDVQIDPVPASAAVTPMALSAEGQAAFIESMAATDDGRAAIHRSLATPIRLPPTTPAIDRSLTRVRRRVTFVIRTTRFHEADRITEATVNLSMPEGWRVRSYSGYEEVRTPLKVATLTTVATRNLGVEATLPVPPDPTVSTGVADSRTTARDLGVEVVEFLPVLRPDRASFTLRAPFPQINVAGRYAVDLTLEPDAPGRTEVLDFDWKGTTPDSLRRRILEWSTKPNAEVTVDYEYVLRRVYRADMSPEADGARSIPEDDDRVRYELTTGTLGTPRALVDADDTEAVVILAELDAAPLVVVETGAPGGPGLVPCLVFHDARSAVGFRDWMAGDRSARTSGPGWRLQVASAPGQLDDLPATGTIVLRRIVLHTTPLPAACPNSGTS